MLFFYLFDQEHADIGGRLEEVYKRNAPLELQARSGTRSSCRANIPSKIKTVRGARWSQIWTCSGDRYKPIRIKTLKLAVALVMNQIMVVRRPKSIGKARKLSR
ncbi:hypothetical protein Y032_0119g840 [Ancylostoma ceylanicum]|uniref:Uncharacterized protein n=1 Tax=Ancylostoma ceylanicum TaxID=53326 RepID=A0A016TB56_9BILA|nr:hypothetical protein Y032_0119g840 [Ancylostoma ceylanicum]